MLFSLWRNDRDVLSQITLTQQHTVPGCAATARFVAVINCLGRFELATLFISDWCVDTAVRLRCSRSCGCKNRDQTKKRLQSDTSANKY